MNKEPIQIHLSLDQRAAQAAVMADANEFFSLSRLIHSTGLVAVVLAWWRGWLMVNRVTPGYWAVRYGWPDVTQRYRLVSPPGLAREFSMNLLCGWCLCACNQSLVWHEGVEGVDDFRVTVTPDGMLHVYDGVCGIRMEPGA